MLAIDRRPDRHTVVPCDAPLCGDENFVVVEHHRAVQFAWEPGKVQFFLSAAQCRGELIKGAELRKELSGKPVLNACVLEFLLAKQHLIPEEWKTKVVFFWGTIYNDANGEFCVRTLFWDGDVWRSDYAWLDEDWCQDFPAVLRMQ